jgi:Fe-S cluster biogenesis protein NfuA
MTGAREAAERVEDLLARVRGGPDPSAGAIAEELVGCLVRLYGAGLARIVAMIGPEGGRDLCDDPLVESLLLVHDLHPLDAGTRIRRAVDRVRVRLPQYNGNIEYLGLGGDGVARVRLDGGQGCRSTGDAVRRAVETAVEDAAPDVAGVRVEVGEPLPPLLQITRRPTLVSGV